MRRVGFIDEATNQAALKMIFYLRTRQVTQWIFSKGILSKDQKVGRQAVNAVKSSSVEYNNIQQP
jgi:hypothetical protein